MCSSHSQPSVRARFRVLALILAGGLFVAACGDDPDATSKTRPADTAQAVQGDTLVPFMQSGDGDVTADVPFVESPQPVVDSMLALAEVSSNDVVYDLGSGDGRIPITAAQDYGARGVGIEIKPDLAEKARQNAEDAGVSDRVEIRQGDLFQADIGEATVVTLYLLPNVNIELRPKLFRELEPGTRVVSHDFSMEEWSPDTTITVDENTIYLWTIPEEVPSFVDLEE